MGLWRQRDFLKLWAGQTISLLGTQVTGVALALTAAVVLQATPAEMGVIGTLNVLPFVFFGLPAGVWVDRVQRRWVLIGAKLALAEAIARVGGPSVAGVLVQLFTAPVAILVDCASYVVSACSLFTIAAREQPAHAAQTAGLRNQVGEGIQLVARHTLLRPLFIGTTLGNAADGLAFQSGAVVLLLTRELRLDAATIGAVFAGLAIGGLIGAALAGPLRQTVGLGATILGCLTLWSLGYGGLAFTTQSTSASVVAAILLGAFGAINPIAGANITTVRQIVTPHSLLGRVTAVGTVGSAAAIAAGSFFGGVLGDTIGLRPTLLISVLLPLLGVASVLLSPVRRLRRVEMLASEVISLPTESFRQ